jgi:hypothetical protein
MSMLPLNDFPLNRRTFLSRSFGGLGTFALAQLLAADGLLAAGGEAPARSGLLAPRTPHGNAKARSVICLFQHGGPSQMALFDPKPRLEKEDGKPYPGKIVQHFHEKIGKVMAPPFRFAKYGDAGMDFSELVPHTASIADDITLVRSMQTNQIDHSVAVRTFHSGGPFSGRPTMGSWVTYGLGSESQNLPAYVVLTDPGGLPIVGPENWTSGYLPALYQGTPFRPGKSPVLNLEQPSKTSALARQNQLHLLDRLNRAQRSRFPKNTELDARISNYELAARMQTAVPGVIDLSNEPEGIRKLYGLDKPVTAEYGRRCLMARRLVEQGVRFVLILLSGQPWDTHMKENSTLESLCPRTDQPSAALVKDLKQRGLLDSTLVLWGGEFGRQPVSEGTGGGRDHNQFAFSLWLAGGGFKAGHVHGATDEYGYKSVEDVVSVWDLQATILHVLGLDHTKLTYRHGGRDDSLTDVDVTQAEVVDELLA